MIFQNSEQSYVFLITIEKVHKHHFSKNSALEIDHQRYSVNNNYWLVEQGSFLFSFFSYCQQLNDSFRIFFAAAFPILIFVVFFHVIFFLCFSRQIVMRRANHWFFNSFPMVQPTILFQSILVRVTGNCLLKALKVVSDIVWQFSEIAN